MIYYQFVTTRTLKQSILWFPTHTLATWCIHWSYPL